MLTYFIFIIFCLISVLGHGFIFNKLLFKSKFINIGEIGLFGFFLLFFISLLAHFFIPLSYWFNLFILIIGLLIFVYNYKIFKDELVKLGKSYYLLLILILPALFFNKVPADFETYHLPYINYLNDFKIVFGLVNLSNNYAYGHGWLDIIGLFSIPHVENKGVSIIGFLFLYFFLLYLLTEIKNNNSVKIKLFSIIGLTYCFANFNKVENLGTEAQPSLLLIIIILNLLKFIENKEDNGAFVKIFLYFFYALILRIGSLIIIPIIIIIFVLYFKKFFLLLKNYLKLSIFIFSFFVIIISKNFILSGCFSYPIYSSCPNLNVSWANPLENTIERYEFISAITKRWKFYILEEGNIDSELDYYDPMQQNIIMSPKAYNQKKFFWIKYFFYDHDVNRLLNSFLIILFCFFSFFIFSKNKSDIFRSLILSPKKINLVYLGIILSNLMWFFLSPQMRYGGYGIIGGSLIFISSITLCNLKFEKKIFTNISIFLIFISACYFLNKNITRISNHFSKQSYVNNSFWPSYKTKIKGEDYITKKFNDVDLNLVLTAENIKEKPLQCGNLKMLCLPEERIVCISSIKVKNGYYFISNDNKKCLSQFKQNYWQH